MDDYSNILWNIHTKSNGTLVSGFVLNEPSDVNQITRGEMATFVFHFVNDSLTVESGETYTIEAGTTEIYESVNVKENGTLNVEGTLIETGGDNLNQLQKYQDHAGSYSTLETLNDTQLYREFIPSSIDISTLLVGVEPVQNLQDREIRGVWGLISSVADEGNPALSTRRVSVEVFVLDRYSAFSDHTAVENSLKV